MLDQLGLIFISYVAFQLHGGLAAEIMTDYAPRMMRRKSAMEIYVSLMVLADFILYLDHLPTTAQVSS